MIELYFVPAAIPSDLERCRPIVVIDIFRASTSITAALAAGAKYVRAAGSQDEAASFRTEEGERAVLAGERKGLKIDGYDLGNSPREMTPERVAGRPVIFDSTNGTRLLRRFTDFDNVIIGSLVSLSATLSCLKQFALDPVFCCAATEGRFSGEDTLAAAMMISRLTKLSAEKDDAAIFAERLLQSAGSGWRNWAKNSFHGKYLTSLGLAEDLDFCLSIDRFDFVPIKVKDKIIRYQK